MEKIKNKFIEERTKLFFFMSEKYTTKLKSFISILEFKIII